MSRVWDTLRVPRIRASRAAEPSAFKGPRGRTTLLPGVGTGRMTILPPENASLQQQFLLLWCRMADFAVQYPDAMQYLESHRERLESEDEVLAVPSILTELVELLRRARIAKDQPPLVLSAIVWGAFLQLFKLHRRGDRPFSEDLVRSSGQCCLDAISRPRPASPLPAVEGRMTILRER